MNALLLEICQSPDMEVYLSRYIRNRMRKFRISPEQVKPKFYSLSQKSFFEREVDMSNVLAPHLGQVALMDVLKVWGKEGG